MDLRQLLLPLAISFCTEASVGYFSDWNCQFVGNVGTYVWNMKTQNGKTVSSEDVSLGKHQPKNATYLISKAMFRSNMALPLFSRFPGWCGCTGGPCTSGVGGSKFRVGWHWRWCAILHPITRLLTSLWWTLAEHISSYQFKLEVPFKRSWESDNPTCVLGQKCWSGFSVRYWPCAFNDDRKWGYPGYRWCIPCISTWGSCSVGLLYKE